jgi:hypothetical protein
MQSVRGRRLFELIIKLFAFYELKKDHESMGHHVTFPNFLKMYLNSNAHEPARDCCVGDSYIGYI